MNKQENFAALVERAMLLDGVTHMKPVIEKELLHYDILFALDDAGLLDKLTFQGGTSLRLCYGSSRFSEDLDFVGGKNLNIQSLLQMKSSLENHIGKRYGLEVSIKSPKETEKDPEYQDIKISKWQISVTTAPERKDIPRQKIKIEIGNIPAYSREPKAILLNYDFLPDGYSDTLIMTESLDEIMADKLISLANCQRYVRHRDIWDLRWLKQKGAKIIPEYIKAKIRDYNITDYPQKLDEKINTIDDIIQSREFYNEMSRFIPMNVQSKTLLKDNFKILLANEIRELLNKTKVAITE